MVFARRLPSSGTALPTTSFCGWTRSTTHFHPETSQAALRVLRAAGFDVSIPEQRLCCGRPLYDFGMLDQAKRYLQTRHGFARPTPSMQACRSSSSSRAARRCFATSCATCFPDDARATRLRGQTFLLSRVSRIAAVPAYEPPQLARKVLLHGHCHHKAIMKTRPTRNRCSGRWAPTCSRRMPAAAAWRAHSDSKPRSTLCRRQSANAFCCRPCATGGCRHLIVSDGFSCREQIRQATGRRALHLADVLNLASPQIGD